MSDDGHEYHDCQQQNQHSIQNQKKVETPMDDKKGAITAAQVCTKLLQLQLPDEISCQALRRYEAVGLNPSALDQLQATLPIIYPWNKDYNTLRIVYNRQYCNIFPIGIVVCRQSSHVAKALALVNRYNLSFRTRCGRHNSLTYSVDADIVIDLYLMNSIEIIPLPSPGQCQISGAKSPGIRGQKLVKLGPGARNGTIAQTLSPLDLILPTGSCVTVCAGGLTLGGGISPFLIRLGGFTCDHLVSATVILADGKEIKVSATEHPDLFFALRGAGNNNFGIVTEMIYWPLVFRGATVFDIRFPFPMLSQVFQYWQQWAPSTDRRLSTEIDLMSPHALPLPVVLRGQFDGPLGELYPLIRHFIKCSKRSAVPKNQKAKWHQNKQPEAEDPCGLLTHEAKDEECKWLGQSDQVDSKRNIQIEIKWLPTVADVAIFWGGTRQSYFKNLSLFWNNLLPIEAINVLISSMTRAPGPLSVISFNAMGGAISDVPISSTAIPHRQALFWNLVQGRTEQFSEVKAQEEWVTLLYDQLARYANPVDSKSPRTVPAYANIVQENLLPERRYLRAYYGPNVERLVQIKQRYDPLNRFNYPQSIPVSGS